MKSISKSRFISGIQCEKKVWFDYHRKDLKPPVDEQTQMIFDLGHKIGFLAQQKFPNGKDATPENYTDFSASIENTKKWISEQQTIYEATFSAGNVLSMLDILYWENGELNTVEVKNSTSVKDYHLWDAAVQYWVMNEAGYSPNRFLLMHINNQYVKDGEISDELFHLVDLTERVIDLQPWITNNIKRIINVVSNSDEPKVEIGGHCGTPFGCDYQHHCWKHVPENSVFTLYRGGKKGWDLYNQGILKLEDIPEEYQLTSFQRLQWHGLKFKKNYVDSKSIIDFFSKWKYPLHFFDFETIFPAVPVLDGTRPYQQVPFQYSLHVLNAVGEVNHKEFLASPEDFSEINIDPRKQMIEQMKLDFEAKGSIVTYNQSFEISRLRELAQDFPEDADFLEGLIERVVDLLVVFQKGWYYLPEMRNSASIKSVLPALAPEFSYADLEVGDGGMASNLYLQSIENKGFVNDLLRDDLLKYCERDTYGMVVIFNILEKLPN